MQNQIHCLEMGLKALTLFTSKEPPLSSPSSQKMISNKNSNTLPPNNADDDYIGNETFTDLGNENGVAHSPSPPENQLARANKSNYSKKKKEKKVFPPPIPLLARTQNLASHMPWILKRYYTSEGRLILKEEKVRHHEYFRAHRANGRLTLQLVPLDNGDGDYDGYYDDEFLRTSEVESVPTSHSRHEETNECSHDHKSSVVENDENGVVGGTNGGGAHKCLKFNSVRSSAPSSCNFGIPVHHHFRTVHG